MKIWQKIKAQKEAVQYLHQAKIMSGEIQPIMDQLELVLNKYDNQKEIMAATSIIMYILGGYNKEDRTKIIQMAEESLKNL